ncbi:MAG: 6-pyruvoyl-tetrahydropterin synthase-related protein [Terracidiphilus sp.]
MTPTPSALMRAFTGPALILLTALVASLALVLHGASCGHDFDFHLVSWLDALHGWRQGIFYPHWAPSPNYGAGEPRFVFYPPLTWMAGALLGACMPWQAVPVALTLLMLFAAGLATRALARQMLPPAPATFAGCVVVFSGYTLFTAYERSAFGELSGSFWMPLLLLLLLREINPEAARWRRAFDGSAVLLVLVVAGAWLSDAPLGVIASYTLAALALIAAILRRSWAPILRAAVAVALGLGLAAVYLVPADREEPWVAIHQVTDDPGYMIQNSWLFARHAGAAMREHDAELFKVSVISSSMIALALLGAALVLRKATPAMRRQWWIPLATIPIAVLCLQLPFSLPIWNLLPELRFLQFPWRWLVALEAPMAILFAAAVWSLSPLVRKVAVSAWVALALFLAAASISGLLFYQICDDEDAVSSMLTAYSAGTGFEGTDEYAPPGVGNSITPFGLPMACLASSPFTVLGQSEAGEPPAWNPDQGTCHATYDADRSFPQTSEHLRFHASTPQAGYLILRLRRYPAWQIRLNGQLQHNLPQRNDGLIAIPVPQGPIALAVDWTTTPDVSIGRTICALSCVLLAGLWFIERRQTTPQVS